MCSTAAVGNPPLIGHSSDVPAAALPPRTTGSEVPLTSAVSVDAWSGGVLVQSHRFSKTDTSLTGALVSGKTSFRSPHASLFHRGRRRAQLRARRLSTRVFRHHGSPCLRS